MNVHFARMGLLTAAISVAAACSDDTGTETGSATEHGAFLFGHTETGGAGNTFTCATCHAAGSSGTRALPGASLAGVTSRPSYWGGAVLDLLDAVNACRITFMSAERPWLGSDEDARALYAYLSSLGPGDSAAAVFSVVRETVDLPHGDATRGAGAYARACRACHGDRGTAAGRSDERIPALPDDVARAHSPAFGYAPSDVRLVVIEKARHGAFLGYSGRMPPFSREALSDGDLADVLAFLGL
ncbi:MAG: c-type cytochrome [Polyangiaceae bacterium]